MADDALTQIDQYVKENPGPHFYEGQPAVPHVRLLSGHDSNL